MVPTEAKVGSHRRTTMSQDARLNNRMLRDCIDATEEERDQALFRITSKQWPASTKNESVTEASKKATSCLGKYLKTLRNGRPANLEETVKARTR